MRSIRSLPGKWSRFRRLGHFDGNPVYPHHTSLLFGCDLVNGGNYWQEGLERGRMISVNAVLKNRAAIRL